MRQFRCLILSTLILSAALSSTAVASVVSKVDGDLFAAYDEQGKDALLPVNVILRAQVDAEQLRESARAMSREVRRKSVTRKLKTFSEENQADLLRSLDRLEGAGDVTGISTLWIVNAVHALATERAVDKLSLRDDVAWIGYDRRDFALSGLVREEERKTGREGNAISGSDGPVPAASDTAWGVRWIHAPQVWRMGYRGRHVLVAVIDTGIWYDHPDLANRIWTNPGEIPGDGIDNDHNGYVDDVHGYDFNAGDADPTENGIGHGTHVSGTVAGDGSGGTLTGVAPEASLMACKALDDWGYGQEWDAWEAIQYAVDNGAQVIQGSIGWIHSLHNPDRASWRELCDNVLAAGVIMSIAAGNERGWYSPPDDIRTPGDCPPPWHHPDQADAGRLSAVLTVGATGYMSDSYAYFSSTGPSSWEFISPYDDYPYGPEMGLLKPDICAPGKHINSTVIGGGYSGDTWDGTSMATPHNSGLIALMLSKDMAMTPEVVDSILETTSLDLGTPGKDNDYGSGRIRADAALLATPELAGVTITLAPYDTVMPQGSNLNINVLLDNTRPTPLTFDFWMVVRTPSGRPVQVLSPTSHTLDGHESVSGNLTFPIRSRVPAGDYEVAGIIGGYPYQVMDKNLFSLTITSGEPW